MIPQCCEGRTVSKLNRRVSFKQSNFFHAVSIEQIRMFHNPPSFSPVIISGCHWRERPRREREAERRGGRESLLSRELGKKYGEMSLEIRNKCGEKREGHGMSRSLLWEQRGFLDRFRSRPADLLTSRPHLLARMTHPCSAQDKTSLAWPCPHNTACFPLFFVQRGIRAPQTVSSFGAAFACIKRCPDRLVVDGGVRRGRANSWRHFSAH